MIAAVTYSKHFSAGELTDNLTAALMSTESQSLKDVTIDFILS